MLTKICLCWSILSVNKYISFSFSFVLAAKVLKGFFSLDSVVCVLIVSKYVFSRLLDLNHGFVFLELDVADCV